MLTSRPTLAFALSVCMTLGCTAEERSAQAAQPNVGNGQRDTRAGVLSMQAGSAVYELILVATSAPTIELSRVVSLATDSRGNAYVADFPSMTVYVLSPNGSLLRKLGGRGGGPGEFRSVSTVQVVEQDSLYVFDADAARLTVFVPHSSDVAYTTSLATGAYWVEKAIGTGLLIAAYAQRYSPSDDPARDTGRVEIIRALRRDGGIARDSILVFPGRPLLVLHGQGRMSVGTDPFGRQGLFDLTPDGRVVFSLTDTVFVRLVEPSGKRVRGFRVPAALIRITPADIQRKAEAMSDPAMARLLRSRASRTWPRLRSLVVDDHSHIWLGLMGPGGRGGSWVVYDTLGRQIGRAATPPDIDIKAIWRGHAYAVAPDGLDVPTIVFYRVRERR